MPGPASGTTHGHDSVSPQPARRRGRGASTHQNHHEAVHDHIHKVVLCQFARVHDVRVVPRPPLAPRRLPLVPAHHDPVRHQTHAHHSHGCQPREAHVRRLHAVLAVHVPGPQERCEARSCAARHETRVRRLGSGQTTVTTRAHAPMNTQNRGNAAQHERYGERHLTKLQSTHARGHASGGDLRQRAAEDVQT